MKRFLMGLIVVFVSGCGGGGGESSSLTASQHVPGIANLSYSPKSAALNSGGGAAIVTALFNFIDAGGDINQVTTTVQDADTYEQLSTRHIPITITSGMTGGTISITVNAPTSVSRRYLFNIHVNDTAGNHSNPLTGIFSVN